MLLYLQTPEQNNSREAVCSLPQPQQPVIPTAWVPPSHANAASPGSRLAYTSRPAGRSHQAARDAADHSHAAVLHTAPAHPELVIDLTADDQASQSSSVDSDLMIVSQPPVDAASGHAAHIARTHGDALQAASASLDQTRHCVNSTWPSAARQRPVPAVSRVAPRQHDHPAHEGNAVPATRKRSRWDMRPADMQAVAELCYPGHHAQAEHSQTQQQIRPVPYCEDAMPASAEAVSDRLAPRTLSYAAGARDSRDQLDRQQETCLSSRRFPSGLDASDRAPLKRPKRDHSGRQSRRSEQAQDRQSRPRQSSHRSDAKRKEPRHRHSHKPRLSQVIHSPISDIDHRLLAHSQAQLDCHAGHDSPDLDRWQMW